MIKKSFIGLVKPRIDYTILTDLDPALMEVSKPSQVKLLLESPLEKGNGELKNGDLLKTGQTISSGKDAVATSPVTGTVSELSGWTGDFGRNYTAVTIDVAKDEDFDEQFSEIAKEITLETAIRYLSAVPGSPPLKKFKHPDVDIHTIIVNGMDEDIFVTTNQYVVQSRLKALKSGIAAVGKFTGINSIVLVAPERLAGMASTAGIETKVVNTQYPSAQPKMIIKDLFGKVVPAGKKPENLGYCFMSAEAVASIGTAVSTGKIPTDKILTLIRKDGSTTLVSVRIGTPVSEVFKAGNITVNDKDQVIFGGPLTGSAIYSEDHPIMPDTDAIMVQDKDNIPFVSDYPCVNCGECVRICPARIQVNMLVRLLEPGHYDEAASNYDLHSCIECGLCSFVCVARIPIFQYIRLAKYELDRIRLAEAEYV
jgi:Na+-translocating ferredoxin:NAD+ oxidoreductase subunit C